MLASATARRFRELLKVVNKESQNLHAEILLRLAGQKAKSLGTAEAGAEAAREFFIRSGVAAEASTSRMARACPAPTC